MLNNSYYRSVHQSLCDYFPGLLFAGIVAFAANVLAAHPLFYSNGIGAMSLALLIGILLGNTLIPLVKGSCSHGIELSKTKLLKLGIILYGFRIGFNDFRNLGIAGIIIDVLVIISTFLISLFIGKFLFKLNSNTTILIGSGSSICGVAAILATAPVVKAKPEQVSIAVATIVFFGAFSIFIYPVIYHFTQTTLNLGLVNYGIYVGSTVYEVAQVVAVSHAIGTQSTDLAVLSKMVRVMMLAPFLLTLFFFFSYKNNTSISTSMTIPWFALFFIAISLLNSLVDLPFEFIQTVTQLDNIILIIAMAALGLNTQFSVILGTGSKPILLSLILASWLIFGGLAINYIVMAILS